MKKNIKIIKTIIILAIILGGIFLNRIYNSASANEMRKREVIKSEETVEATNNEYKLTEEEQKFYKNRGKLIRERANTEESEENLYANGKTVSIYQQEMEVCIDAYVAGGKTREEAEEASLDYLVSKKCLINKAIQEGYDVTEQEVENYINSLKEVAQEDGAESNIRAEIEGFGSEKEYWDFMKEPTYENLLLEKYEKDLMNSWAEEHQLDTNSQEFRDGWKVEMEDIEQRLIEEENVLVR